MKNIGGGMPQLNPYIRYVNKLTNATKGYHVPWRILYDFEMIYVTKGVCTVETKEKKYTVGEGCLHIMPPFLYHKRDVDPAVETDYYDVHFDFIYNSFDADFAVPEIYMKMCADGVEEAPVDKKLSGRRVIVPEFIQIVESLKLKNSLESAAVFERMYKEWSKGTASGLLNAKAAMLQVIAMLTEDIGGGKSDIFAGFIGYIFDHYFEDIDLERFVSGYGISVSRFRYLFKSRMKKAPQEFIIDFRVEQAKKLLASGDYTVSEVSDMVGYDDIHYFSRMFKKKTDMSPTEYKRQNYLK